MKKIKLYVFGILLAMSVFALTACGSSDNTENTTSGTTNPTTTQAVTTDKETTSMNESSTGVIGGMVDDVERGVNDVMDGTEKTTNAADETTR